MKKEFLGNFLLRSGQRLTVSDPCYNADVWCRKTFCQDYMKLMHTITIVPMMKEY